MIADYCIKNNGNLVAVCSYRFYNENPSILDVQNFVGRLNKLEVPLFGGTKDEKSELKKFKRDVKLIKRLGSVNGYLSTARLVVRPSISLYERDIILDSYRDDLDRLQSGNFYMLGFESYRAKGTIQKLLDGKRKFSEQGLYNLLYDSGSYLSKDYFIVLIPKNSSGELTYNKVKESLSKGCLGLGVGKNNISGLQLLFIDSHLGI